MSESVNTPPPGDAFSDGAAAGHPSDPLPPLPTKRVLLVEDNFMVAMAVRGMLVSLGLEVVATVASVAEGLAAVERGGFDIGLLDVSIVGGSSEPVARSIIARGLPVAFVTGYGATAVLSNDLQKWPRLCKPFGASELRDALVAALRA